MSSNTKFRIDGDRYCIRTTFEKHGWVRNNDWNVYWGSVWNVRSLFGAESSRRLSDSQIINHFPTHLELTRKDLMARNIKRYKKDLERDTARHDAGAIPDIIPETYILPLEANAFDDRVKKGRHETWIVKPNGRAQGKGIKILDKPAQVKQLLAKCARMAAAGQALSTRYVVSAYVGNPLLIAGKKFDMRLYVLVVSYRPLKAYIYKHGFCRFCTEAYNSDVGDMYAHLTNVAIQKQADNYDDRNGGKWHVDNLRLYIEGHYGTQAARGLFSAIEALIVHSLRAVQPAMINDRHCFECYGYDILLDDTLKPWLLEVNASPSLSASTASDRLMKSKLLTDIYRIVIPPGFPNTAPDRRRVVNMAADKNTGDFLLLVSDEK